MPKIVLITIAHLMLATGSGLMLGLGVFGAGFSDSSAVHSGYTVLVMIWQILDAPAGPYILHATSPNGWLLSLLQLLTSFIWANIVVLILALWKARRTGF